MAMTEQQIQAKIDALTAKKKEIQKKERAKKKKALAKAKEAEAKKEAELNAKIVTLAMDWFSYTDKEKLMRDFEKNIAQREAEKARKEAEQNAVNAK